MDGMNQNTIPVVDLSAADAAKAVDTACRSLGFFYLTGHGVREETVRGAFRAAKDFFASPAKFKDAYHIRHAHPHQRGYVPLFEESLSEAQEGDPKESFDMGVDLAPNHPDVLAGKPFTAPNVWPGVEGFKDRIDDYYADMLRIGAKLGELTATGLGLDADYFDAALTQPIGNLRLLHYPGQSKTQDYEGCGPHTDYGFMTVLAQDDVGGLQIEGDDGAWIDVPPMQGAFVVNLGDLLTRWTAGRYRARNHRVIRRGPGSRYSIPFFFDPNGDAIVDVVPTCRNEPGSAEIRPVSAADYLQSRFDATFSYRQ